MSHDAKEIIRVRGARTHNLRAIDLDIPRGKFVVFTGVSGSGKTSLVFDTLFAEGQRRYIESLSPFSRQFLDQLERPDVDDIDGLPPTVSVSGAGWSASHNPRSLVATLTEIHDYLRVLYARLGDVFCHQCGAPLGQQSVEQIVSSIMSQGDGSRFVILAPLVRGRKGEHRDALLSIRRDGFLRARIDGEIRLVDPLPSLDPSVPHDIEMVVDRQIVRPSAVERIRESIESAVKFGQGTVILSRDVDGRWVDQIRNTRLCCLTCQISYRELEPRTFSFNSPYGACPHCEGLGIVQEYSLDRCVADRRRSIRAGALASLGTGEPLEGEGLRINWEDWEGGEKWLDVPFEQLPDHALKPLWEGNQRFEGILKVLQLREAAQPAASWEDLKVERPCPACGGARLAAEGRSVQWAGRALHEFLSMTIDDALEHARSYRPPSEREPVAAPLLREIVSRLEFLRRVGVGYIQLDRPVRTLSGGEAQRIRLASCLGAGLHGACYILDEPTMGLHPTDTARLIAAIEELRREENSILVIEHDPWVMERADWLVDLGPGAGRYGGSIVHAGTFAEFVRGPGSTAEYLSGRKSIHRPSLQEAPRAEPRSLSLLVLEGATHRNLHDVTLRLPLQRLVAITGVSGSGKSSLVIEVLLPAIQDALKNGALGGPLHRRLHGVEHIAKVVEVDQSPIGGTPRSCPATAIDILGSIRRVFASTREAKTKGWKSSRFNFSDKSGQCPACGGLGATRLAVSYWPERFIPCRTCQGKRYSRTTLGVKYRGQSIADVLTMSVSDAADFFQNHPRILGPLKTLMDIGLGYLSLGQWATTLSGGEAQRLKLAAELTRVSPEATLFILDEPTTGLHFEDVAQLLGVLDRLIENGHSVVVIEHNLEIVSQADWIVDLGPSGGHDGGRIIAEGTPRDLSQATTSATGQALRSRDSGQATAQGFP